MEGSLLKYVLQFFKENKNALFLRHLKTQSYLNIFFRFS